MIIYPVTALYFGFNAWCMYMAWYRPVVFEKQLQWVDQTIDDNHIFWMIMLSLLTAFTVWGVIYSGLQ